MSQRDRTAVGVDAVRVGLALAFPRQDDRRERLVALEHVDVTDAETGALERGPGRVNWPGEHEDGVHADQRLRANAGPWAQPQRVSPLGTAHDDGSGAVRDLG